MARVDTICKCILLEINIVSRTAQVKCRLTILAITNQRTMVPLPCILAFAIGRQSFAHEVVSEDPELDLWLEAAG